MMSRSALCPSPFQTDAFEEFLAAREEPAWLTELRREAWGAFLDLPMPNAKQEEWARIDVRAFHLERFGFAEPVVDGAARAPGLLREGVILGGWEASQNGHSTAEHLDEKWARRGVLFGSLARLVAEHGPLLERYLRAKLVDPQADKFAALAAACWSGGTLLYVPPGVVVDQPLHAIAGLTPDGVDLSRTVVILDEGAEATLLAETASGAAADAGLHVGSVELFVGPNALLRYVNLQNWGPGVWHFARHKAVVERNASLQWTIGALGGRLAKVNQHVSLAGPGATAQVNGVMFTEGRQSLAYHTRQDHEAGACHSDLLYKGALQDQAHIVWRGMIHVNEQAQKTDAYQRNDNLMLSDSARADSIPGLEILADDVRCTHGVTIGRVDDELLFYAATRGLTRKEAARMVVIGFFQQVLDRITIPSVREALGEAIGRRVREYA